MYIYVCVCFKLMLHTNPYDPIATKENKRENNNMDHDGTMLVGRPYAYM